MANQCLSRGKSYRVIPWHPWPLWWGTVLLLNGGIFDTSLLTHSSPVGEWS